MNDRPTRVVGILLLLCLLAGLFVWAGTMSPNPTENRYPGTTELLNNYDDYLGDSTQIGGTVIQTNPVVLEVSDGAETRELTVRNLREPVPVREQLVVFGTVRSDNTIVANRSMSREPWEAQYMYAVSFLAGLWVLGRLVNGWRFNRDQWTVEPRDTPLVALLRGDDA